jgi:nucleoside-diphosphate-sugar epimerase
MDFVTGATGCLGHYVVKALLEKGRRVVCAVRSPKKLENDDLFRSPLIQTVPCDFVSDGWEKDIADTLNSCENVFHCAAEMPHRPTCRWDKEVLWKVNVEGAEKLYALAKNTKRFLHTSSISIYGDWYDEPRDEDAATAPADPYAASKLEAEKRLLALSSKPGAPALFMVRPGAIYGRKDTNTIQKMIELIDRRVFRLLGAGDNARATTAAPLIADIFCRMAGMTERGLILNVIDPRVPTMHKLAADIAKLLGVPAPAKIPMALAYPPAAVFSLLHAAGLQTRFKLSDIRKFTTSTPILDHRQRTTFGETPDFYLQALTDDVAWYREKSQWAKNS